MRQPYFKIHYALSERLPAEYLQSVIEGSLKIKRSERTPADTIIAICPQEVVAILDRQAGQAALVPIDHIYRVVSESTKTQIQSWLAEPDGPFYVMRHAGSWFLDRRMLSDWP